jgi:formylglycine-generating enzyme required for sulfatase activity
MQEVSALRPNSGGVFGLYGNAMEWCMDIPVLYPLAASISGDSGQGGQVSDSASRVLRGGSFSYYATYMRSAYRYYYRPDDRDINLGFRVSRTYNLRP